MVENGGLSGLSHALANGGHGSVTPASVATTVSGPVAAVLKTSGADLDTDYPVPAGAVLVAPGGDDRGAGTRAAPLRTLAAAIARAPAGGTVVLRGGTYRQAAGSLAKKLTIQAYPHEYPVLSGADVVTGWAAEAGAWHTTDWTSPFAADQFRADEVVAGSAAGRVEQAFRDGTALTQVLTRAELAPGRFWVDPATRQLYLADDPTTATVELSRRVRGLTLQTQAAGSRIRGLRFTAYAAPHLDNSGNLYVGSSDTLIEHSQFDHSSGAGLKIAGANLTVDHITVSDNAAEGMQGNRNHHSVIENSRFVRNNTDRFKTTDCAMACTVAGFKTAHTAGLQVLNNAFVDNAANGFWCDLGCTGAVITGNAITGSFDAILYEVSSQGTIADNYIERSHSGIRISGSDQVRVLNNELSDNVWQFTVYDSKRASSSDPYSAALGLSWDTTGLVVAGNTVRAGPSTVLLLQGNATAQVASPQMFSTLTGNTNTGTQAMTWCPRNGTCTVYGTIAGWKAVSGLSF